MGWKMGEVDTRLWEEESGMVVNSATVAESLMAFLERVECEVEEEGLEMGEEEEDEAVEERGEEEGDGRGKGVLEERGLASEELGVYQHPDQGGEEDVEEEQEGEEEEEGER